MQSMSNDNNDMRLFLNDVASGYAKDMHKDLFDRMVRDGFTTDVHVSFLVAMTIATLTTSHLLFMSEHYPELARETRDALMKQLEGSKQWL